MFVNWSGNSKDERAAVRVTKPYFLGPDTFGSYSRCPHDFREPGRSPCSDRRSNCDCNRRVASRFLADSSLRLAHSTAHKKIAGGVSCHLLKQIPCGGS